MLHVQFTGSHYEIGLQLGRTLAHQVDEAEIGYLAMHVQRVLDTEGSPQSPAVTQ